MSKCYRGSCLCGGIKFQASGFSPRVANCHCSMCRKFHGAAYGTLVSVSNLEWLMGEENLKEYVADNGTIRTFCSRCGSSLGFRVAGAAASNIELAIATFDENIPVSLTAQIFTKFKANWVHLHAEVPVFEEGQESE